MTVDRYNYMDKGDLRNRIRELEAVLQTGMPDRYINRIRELEGINAMEKRTYDDAIRRIEELESELASRTSHWSHKYVVQRDAAIARAEKAEARIAELEAEKKQLLADYWEARTPVRAREREEC